MLRSFTGGWQVRAVVVMALVAVVSSIVFLVSPADLGAVAIAIGGMCADYAACGNVDMPCFGTLFAEWHLMEWGPDFTGSCHYDQCHYLLEYGDGTTVTAWDIQGDCSWAWHPPAP